jgi:phytoene dehydrogenase-like protein
MVPVILKWKRVPITQYAARYRHPFLREAMVNIAGDARMSALVLVMVLAYRSLKCTGFVSGGSQVFADAIADRYARLGGAVRYGTRATSILVESNRATGVRCADEKVIPASTVISCADGHTTLFKMLEGRFLNRNIRHLYEHGELFSALIQVSLGVDKVFTDAPHSISLPLAEPLVVDDQTQHRRLEVTLFNADAGLCPTGKTVVTVRMTSRLEYWTRLKKEAPERYRRAKEDLLKRTIRILDQRFPGLADHVENTDVATPVTFVRYTGNWQGSHEGWLPSPRVLGRRLPFTLPGLKDFYMAGHWVIPGGGLPSVALSGRYVAQLICAQRGKSFQASRP